MVTDKFNLQDVEIVALTEECSSVVIQKMPKKLKDLRTFTLPIQINSSEVVYAFSDLGASIILMFLSMFNTLGLGSRDWDLWYSNWQTRPYPILKESKKDALIKVGKFIIHG